MVCMARKAGKNPWGKALKKLRKSLGLKQEEAAKRLFVPLNTYRGWEQGKAAPAGYFRRMIERLMSEG